MDTETMIALAHFKIMFGRETTQRLNMEKFVGDRRYARAMLEIAEDTDQEKLIVSALKLRDLFKLWPEEAHIQKIESSAPAPGKYVKSVWG